jgi:hypothetical protein
VSYVEAANSDVPRSPTWLNNRPQGEEKDNELSEHDFTGKTNTIGEITRPIVAYLCVITSTTTSKIEPRRELPQFTETRPLWPSRFASRPAISQSVKS